MHPQRSNHRMDEGILQVDGIYALLVRIFSSE